MGQEPVNIGYALIKYIETMPEGHMLREIAERALLDFNKRQVIYVDAEVNDGHRYKKYSPAFRRKRPVLKELHSNLADNLKYLRAKNRLTQGVFARELGFTRDIINNIEHKRVRPPMDFLLVLSDKYGYTIEFLITELIKNHNK